jgi:hypothetical protein
LQDELDIVRDVAGRLEKGRFGYMLTGSMAMNFYAEPRMTRDIDIVLAIAPAQSGILANLFSPEYYVSSDAISQSIAHETLFNLLHQESMIKVDCIVRKNSPYRQNEFGRRQRVEIRDFQAWIVSKEDLILSKLLWAKDSRSDTQFRDIRNLLAAGFDRPYIEHWIKELGLDTLWAELNA